MYLGFRVGKHLGTRCDSKRLSLEIIVLPLPKYFLPGRHFEGKHISFVLKAWVKWYAVENTYFLHLWPSWSHASGNMSKWCLNYLLRDGYERKALQRKAVCLRRVQADLETRRWRGRAIWNGSQSLHPKKVKISGSMEILSKHIVFI